jgi:hypothetical protein
VVFLPGVQGELRVSIHRNPLGDFEPFVVTYLAADQRSSTGRKTGSGYRLDLKKRLIYCFKVSCSIEKAEFVSKTNAADCILLVRDY